MLMISGTGANETLGRPGYPCSQIVRGWTKVCKTSPSFPLFTTFDVTIISSLSNATYAAQAVQDYLSSQTEPLANLGYKEVGKRYSEMSVQSIRLTNKRMGKAPRLVSSEPLSHRSLRPVPLPAAVV